MRNRTGRRRSARVLGGFLVAVVVASGAVLATGAGVASAATDSWAVIGSPTSLRQNTQGNEHVEGGVVTRREWRWCSVVVQRPQLDVWYHAHDHRGSR